MAFLHLTLRRPGPILNPKQEGYVTIHKIFSDGFYFRSDLTGLVSAFLNGSLPPKFEKHL